MTQVDARIVVEDAEALAHHAAGWVAERIAETREAGRPSFTIALSGGSTPKRLYEILADEYRDRIDWSRVHVFFGDERIVPPEDDRNNAHMARTALLDRVPIPAANVRPIPTDGAPEALARAYEDTLKAHYRASALESTRPLFDVVLLGLGENGHTASLFPAMPVLENTLDWVATCTPEDAPDTRVTLTYPAIASSREVAFLIAGAGKASVLVEVLGGDRTHPAARISSVGRVNWFLDRAAAGEAA